jgi:hypothetical protein
MTRTSAFAMHGVDPDDGQVATTLAENVPAVAYTCVTVGDEVVTGGEPSPKFHSYVHPLVGGARVSVKTAVAVDPAATHPSTDTVRLSTVGHGAGCTCTQRSVVSSVDSQRPSLHVAVTLTGFPHWQTLAVPKVAVQLPAASIEARTLTGPSPQSTLTFTDPVAHPVAVP